MTMALEATFRELCDRLHRLHDAWNGLQVTLGDKPLNGESAMADDFENIVMDVAGALHDACESALQARRDSGHPCDLDSARRQLALCQERFHQINEYFTTKLASYEKLRELARLGNRRRGEWRAWTKSVKAATEQCQPPLQEATKALAKCWQEISEHSGNTSVSVRTTNVGQRIVATPSEFSGTQFERVT
jgi:hypothetical protein